MQRQKVGIVIHCRLILNDIFHCQQDMFKTLYINTYTLPYICIYTSIAISVVHLIKDIQMKRQEK